MDKDSPRSVLDVPVQMSDDGSVSDVFTDSEQRDLHYDAYSIDWQGRSIPYSSIGGGELGAPSSSTGPRRTSTTKGGVADMLLLFCAFNDGAADAGPVYLADEGDDGELEPAEEAVRQDSGGASTAEAESADDVYDSDSDAIYASESDPNGIIGDDFHAKYSIFTDDDDTNVAAEAREAAAALAAAAAIAGRDAANTAAREAVAELEVCARERRDAAAAAAVAAAAAAAARDEAAAATGKFHAECSVDTGVLTRREEPLSLPALDETSVTGCTYGDIIKSPPPHLRCVVFLPLFSLPPVLRCTAASLPRFIADVPGLRRV